MEGLFIIGQALERRLGIEADPALVVREIRFKVGRMGPSGSRIRTKGPIGDRRKRWLILDNILCKLVTKATTSRYKHPTNYFSSKRTTTQHNKRFINLVINDAHKHVLTTRWLKPEFIVVSRQY